MGQRVVRVLLAVSIAGLVASAEKALALSCGETISVDTTLDSDLGPCLGDGLIVDTANVTLDLNGKTIIGNGTSNGVRIEGVENVTVKNGTIENFNVGVNAESGSHGARILNMVLKRHKLSGAITGGSGVQVTESNNVVVKDSRLTKLQGSGLDVTLSDNFTLENNLIENVGTKTQNAPNSCGTGNGIFIGESDGAQILNNSFKRVSQSGILFWGDLGVDSPSSNGLIDGNTVTQTSSRPCIGTDFGAITIVSKARNVTVSRNMVTNNKDAAIGLRRNLEDIRIVGNVLKKNEKGIFLSRGVTGATFVHNNCISKDKSGIGLEVDSTDAVTYDINAENNFWEATDGPSGVGPGGAALSGSGEEIVQKATDSVDVEPFLEKCRL